MRLLIIDADQDANEVKALDARVELVLPDKKVCIIINLEISS